MIMEAASVGSSHHPEGLETKTLKLLNLGCSEEKPPSTENQTWSKDGSLGGIRRAALGAPEILQTGCGSCPGQTPCSCRGEEALPGWRSLFGVPLAAAGSGGEGACPSSSSLSVFLQHLRGSAWQGAVSTAKMWSATTESQSSVWKALFGAERRQLHACIGIN